ncbi:MAG TPA: 16S rRNA (adenine(1518)-N(6)/adenine(1519)-N(6))-dimethyltransferase RsmA [Candidatus Paceibacterota bacterium]
MFAKKSLGQNFLMHRQTAERIADAAHLAPEDTVLEIGPGTGMLTAPLLARAGKVIAVEADAALAEKLGETFASEIAAGKLELVEGDIRTFDPAHISGEYALVANIPYYITGEIIRKFLEASHTPRSMTLLVQKEVAERVARDPKESLLSISVKTYGAPHYEFTVPRGAFKPAPKVDSAVLSIVDIRNPFSSEAEKQHFFAVLHAGFAHKRKKLAKNLALAFPDADVSAALRAAGLDPDTRAEDVPLPAWHALAKTLLYI